MLGNSGKIVDNYKVDPGKLDSLVLRKGLIEYQVKLQIGSLSLQIAVFSETPVSTFLQIGFTLFAYHQTYH